MKAIALFFVCFFVSMKAFAAMPLVGVYQTIDDETELPKSIVRLYEYQDGKDVAIAGRIIALYDENGNISETINNPIKIANKVSGNPKYVGLDIIWGMEWDEKDSEYTDGKIMDPKKGSIYSSIIWKDHNDKLRVRGKIGPFGRTQTWNVLVDSDLPTELQNIETTNWKPIIRK